MTEQQFVFIRHGQTAGNLEKRYIGRTDEPLCAEGIAALQSLRVPPCETVFVSPMTRCLQTAALLYPDVPHIIHEGLRECDFGDFEGRNYGELCHDTAYCRWLESMGKLPFPHGESHDAFKARCVSAFEECAGQCDKKSAAFIVHGGTVMAILETYAQPPLHFYDYQRPNAHGFLTRWDGEHLRIEKEFAPEEKE